MLNARIAFEWGTSTHERAQACGCDAEVAQPDHSLWRGVTVEAPAPVVFRWLCQLRAAPYSYDWIDNRGRRSPSSLTPGLEQLAVGQPVATIFRIASFECERELTLQVVGRARLVFGDGAISYKVVALDRQRCRLLAKLVVRYPRSLLGPLMRLVLPCGDLVMMRRHS